MKKYVKPEIYTSMFDYESIVTSSAGKAMNSWQDGDTENKRYVRIDYKTDFTDVKIVF